MEIAQFLNENQNSSLNSIGKQFELMKQAQYMKAANKYSQDPSEQNLQNIATINPSAANTILALKKQQAENQAREVRSVYNTWKSVPPSKKGEFYDDMRKKLGDKMRFYPIEYNKESEAEISKMLQADNMAAMNLLGENPTSGIGKIRADERAGYITSQDANKAINKETTSEMPSAVKEYNFFNRLAPAEQQRYLEVKRDTKGLVLNPDGSVSTKTGYTDARKDIRFAETYGAESGKVEGKDAATARVNLSQLEDKSTYAIKLLNELVKHPGLKDVVGMKESSGLPTMVGLKPAAGTKGADFMSRFEQIQGQKFLEAYESLKGAGQITEIEGQKATQAISRINTAQSEKEFIDAVGELKDIINKGLQRARKKAGNTQPAKSESAPSLDDIFGGD